MTASVAHAGPGYVGTLEYTVETSPTGEEILVDITTGAGLETVDGAVFRVHLRSSGQEIPVGGLSFVDNRITLELDERIIHDDKEDVGLSYIAGSVRDIAGNELPYFLDADVENLVLYLHDDPAEGASHFLSSRGVEFGISDSGGGYASRLTIAGVDINVPGYGRGVQSAFRSGLHANAYNPSQAGVRDNVGTL
ncbi:MAG: hypothetical protein VX527_04700, partial [Planctomycetota bacterium]|nr:hypothetical protein [Planctomycetota bacterium]